MTVEKEWTQDQINNAYRQFQVNRLVTEQDLYELQELCYKIYQQGVEDERL